MSDLPEYDAAKHRPMLVTGKIRANKSGPITDLRIKGVGTKEVEWVKRKIKAGYEFVIKRGGSEPTLLIVKDVLRGSGSGAGKWEEHLVTVADNSELNNLSEVPDVEFTSSD